MIFFKHKKTETVSSDFGKEYWDNKYEKAPILYGGRTHKTKNDSIAIDVTQFVSPNDVILQEIVKKYKLKRETLNATALEVQRWVVKFMNYVGDEKTSGVPEFWQFAFEAVQSGTGDCEDGAILMANLLINAGIPVWRVKVGAGYVRESPTAPQGGHAYCLYLSDDPTDEKKLSWKILDWCYYEDSSVSIENKPKAKDGGYKGCYGDVWFTFNSEYSWAGHQINIFDGRISHGQTVLKEEVMKTNAKTLSSIITTVDRKIKNKK